MKSQVEGGRGVGLDNFHMSMNTAHTK
jgi:hypothetical protein